MNALTGVALRFKYNSKESVMASKKALEALENHSGDEGKAFILHFQEPWAPWQITLTR